MSVQPPPLPQHQPPAGAPRNWERATLEKLALAAITEQRTARRWRMGLRLGWLLLFGLIVFQSFQSSPSQSGGIHASRAMPHTAVVEIEGVIADDDKLGSSAKDVIEDVRAAFENDQAKAVVLHINSPGGSPVQSGMINDELTRLKEKHKKPLYAVVSDTCASGAYYIAVAADKIFVDKASIVGSIGVRMDGFGFTGTMEKMGVERRLLTAGDNKAMLDPFSPVSPEQQAHAQTMLNQIHQQFIDVVRKHRGKRLRETPEIFSGLIWTGQEAIRLGLVDELGSVDSVARDVVQQDKVLDYTDRGSVAERLARKFGASVGAGAVNALQMQNHNPLR